MGQKVLKYFLNTFVVTKKVKNQEKILKDFNIK